MKKLLPLLLLFCFTTSVFALPPDMEADRFVVRAKKHIKEQNYKEALKAMESVLALVERHNLDLKSLGGHAFYYAYADVAKRAGDSMKAFEMVNRYLEAAGKSGAHYQKALELYEITLESALLYIKDSTTLLQVKTAIEAGADVNAKGRFDLTPLHDAARSNQNPEVARLLIEKGADMNARNVDGWTPLHDAARSNQNPEVARLLIEKGADVNAKGWFDLTPLLRAARSNQNPEVARLLIEKGADMNARDVNGWTPLHYAAESNQNPEVARLLIEKGADVNAKGWLFGWTPLHVAAESNQNPEVARLLIEKGADVNAKDKYGKTPLYRAAQNNDMSNADKKKVKSWLKNPGLLRK